MNELNELHAAELTQEGRPRNRQGRPRKWGDHCWECRREVQMQWMRQGLCAACYQRHRRAGTIATDYVDPAAATEHLARVYATGKSYRWIAKQAGTSTVNLANLVAGRRRRISGDLHAKIMAVPVPGVIDTEALRRRALQAAGMNGTYIGVARTFATRRQELLKPRRSKGVRRRRVQPAPVIRTVDWSLIACAECERQPCGCPRVDDHDLSWLARLADHDPVAA